MFSYFSLYNPLVERKSGMPLSVETPAPVNTRANLDALTNSSSFSWLIDGKSFEKFFDRCSHFGFVLVNLAAASGWGIHKVVNDQRFRHFCLKVPTNFDLDLSDLTTEDFSVL